MFRRATFLLLGILFGSGCGGTTLASDINDAAAGDSATSSDSSAADSLAAETSGGSDAKAEVGPLSCTSDTACGGPTPRCDVASGTCRGCTTNAHCAAFGLVCDTAAGTCVGCVTAKDCTGGACSPSHECTNACTGTMKCMAPLLCDSASGACVECATDANCKGGRCNPATRACVECLVAKDCPSDAPTCDPVGLACTKGCAGEADCAALSMHCDLTAKLCRECTRNDHCGPKGYCQPDFTCGGG